MDDTNEILEANSYENETKRQTMSKLTNWITTNRLLVNVGKTQIINFHKSRNKHLHTASLKTEYKITEFVKSAKLLEIWFHDNLSRDERLTEVTQKHNYVHCAIRSALK